MNASIEEGKNAFLKVYAAEIKRDHPSWTFARCWQAAQSAHPELAESFAEPESAPTYPYQPAAGSQAKLDQLLQAYLPKRQLVQADKKDDAGELILVMANGEIVDLVLE